MVNDDRVEFRDATHLWGKDTMDTQSIIRRESGDPDTQVVCIGQAGENRVSFACIITGLYSAAGHGGVGAVMGSKKLKALAVRGKKPIEIANLDKYLETCLSLRKMFQDSPGWQAIIKDGGRSNAPEGIRAGIGMMGNLEEPVADMKLADELDRNGRQFWEKYQVGRIGCAGCPVHHFYVFNVPGIGTAAPKCASWAVFANPIWNTDYKLMFEAGALCNRYGLDVGSTGTIISFLMDLYHRGIISAAETGGIAIKRGDREAVLGVIDSLGKQEGFGRLFKDGLLAAARQIGGGAEELALQVKGREMPAGEVRTFKGNALAFAVVKDPLDAPTIPELLWNAAKPQAEGMARALVGSREAAIPDSYQGKGKLVSEMEKRTTVVEMLGVCKWYMLYFTPFLELPARLFSLATGIETTEGELMTAAHRVAVLERSINVSRGAKRADDTLPKRFFNAPVASGPYKGASLDKVLFERMIDEYYEACGYNLEGMPVKETFMALGMGPEYNAFESRLQGARHV
jgi:aldehyde:ferredoxin oxidoreductase